ncbi:Metallo-dependent phosphatase-like protein [Podospora didyma]|uniref:Metallo-dependent phosphatase-like protein n=1 Tax=Podospora didyma TaxID=330526 RepID=A0AAE0P6H1_9PEZI|nr:Metallo-dependent phosphatase-like protein [Podospora didyma]
MRPGLGFQTGQQAAGLTKTRFFGLAFHLDTVNLTGAAKIHKPKNRSQPNIVIQIKTSGKKNKRGIWRMVLLLFAPLGPLWRGRQHPIKAVAFVGLMALVTLYLIATQFPTVEKHLLAMMPLRRPTTVMAPADATMTSQSNSKSPHQDSTSDRSGFQGMTTTTTTTTTQEEDDNVQRPTMADAETGIHTAQGPAEEALRKRIVIADLPAQYIPSFSPDDETKGRKGRRPKRLIVVGDVHGQLHALKTLLRKLDFDHPRFRRHHASSSSSSNNDQEADAEGISNHDHLILAGDIVTKGPDSAGVVQLAMDLGASSVRGNHDENVLRAAQAMAREHLTAVAPERGEDDEDIDAQKSKKNTSSAKEYAKNEHARAVARSLSKSQLSWLASQPIILRIGHGFPGATSPPFNAGSMLVVHAGLVPSLPLARQDRWAVMNMRSLVYPPHFTFATAEDNDEDEDLATADGAASKIVPVDTREGEPWSRAWNRVQNNIKRQDKRTLVVYGHDARAGLQADVDIHIKDIAVRDVKDERSYDDGEDWGEDEEETDEEEVEESSSKKKKHKKKNKRKGIRYAFGLDSGCGHSRQLSALVIEASAEGIVHSIVQVDCGHGAHKNDEA